MRQLIFLWLIIICLSGFAQEIDCRESLEQKCSEGAITLDEICQFLASDEPETNESLFEFLLGIRVLDEELRNDLICARLMGKKSFIKFSLNSFFFEAFSQHVVWNSPGRDGIGFDYSTELKYIGDDGINRETYILIKIFFRKNHQEFLGNIKKNYLELKRWKDDVFLRSYFSKQNKYASDFNGVVSKVNYTFSNESLARIDVFIENVEIENFYKKNLKDGKKIHSIINLNDLIKSAEKQLKNSQEKYVNLGRKKN